MTVSTSKAPDRIAGMFDAIAWRYDRLNRLLSVGLDRRWRGRAIRSLQLTGSERVVDVCTGTADVAMALAPSAREVVGVDFAGEMLKHGLDKVRRAGLGGRVRLVRGDAVGLPLPDRSCQAATIAFGIRNVADPAAACRELHRVLDAGGRLAILEFGMPRTPVVATVYRWYFRHLVPRIGRLISGHGEAYEYLPVSVAGFPWGEAFADVLRAAGFTDVRAKSLTLGSVYLYTARRG